MLEYRDIVRRFLPQIMTNFSLVQLYITQTLHRMQHLTTQTWISFPFIHTAYLHQFTFPYRASTAEYVYAPAHRCFRPSTNSHVYTYKFLEKRGRPTHTRWYSVCTYLRVFYSSHSLCSPIAVSFFSIIQHLPDLYFPWVYIIVGTASMFIPMFEFPVRCALPQFSSSCFRICGRLFFGDGLSDASTFFGN